MSVKASNWAWDQEGLSSGALLVLLALADHANDEGENAYPSSKSLARKCHLTPSTVWRHLQEIENRGLMIRSARFRDTDNRQTSNLYQLQLHGRNEVSHNHIGGVAETAQGVSQDNTAPIAETTYQEPSLEPLQETSDERIRQQPLDPSQIPDWYTDLWSIKGFKTSLTHCQDWMKKNAITLAKANATAAAVKGRWDSKKYKDPWAVFRAWVQRPDFQNAGNPASSARPTRPPGDRTAAELKAQQERLGEGTNA